jgi:hypothetical protein
MIEDAGNIGARGKESPPMSRGPPRREKKRQPSKDCDPDAAWARASRLLAAVASSAIPAAYRSMDVSSLAARSANEPK